MPIRSLFLLVPLALMLVACAPARPPDLVLVVIDTLRADHLAAYGYASETAPTLTALAEDGVLFERVVAPSSWTKTSVASLLTSRDPLRHGVLRETSVLPGDLATLAAALRAAGYQTIGVNANPWLQERYGFAAGFDEYLSLVEPQRGFAPATEVDRRALELAGAAHPGAPLFLYVHYMDVHAPYSWRGSRRGGPRRERVRIAGEGPVPDAVLEQRYRKRGLDGPAVRERVLDLYDAGIGAADRGLADLLAGLDALGRPGPRIVAVTADHGEGFREHGTTEHGWNLYPEVWAVPLVVSGDGIPTGVRIPAQVRSIDLAPTLLALAGVSAPASFDGRPLPTEPEPDEPDRAAVGSLGFGGYVPDRHYVAIVTGTHLFLRERVGGEAAFFDLRTDPGAQHDLGADHPDAAAPASVEARLVLREGEEQGGPIAPETAEALRALGYLE